jgi:hypothetical protein
VTPFGDHVSLRFFGHPLFAIVFGAFILCAETCNHADEIRHPAQWYDLPLYDWSAGVFLIAAGLILHRKDLRGRLYQSAAWGFMVSLLAGAFLGHLAEPQVPISDEWLSATTYTVIIAMLLVAATGALVATIRSRE